MNSTTKNRKVLSAVAIAGVLALGLTACGGGGGDEAADGKVTLEVWEYLGTGSSNDAMVEAVKAFEKANTNITVKRTSFAYADLAKSIIQGGVGGSVPDVAIVDVVDTQTMASLGLLADVTKEVGDQKADFFDGPFQSTQLDGKTYGLPLNSNNLALYYNKAMLTEAGVEAPKTWDELRSTAAATTKDDRRGLALSAVNSEQGTFQFLPFLWQTGGDLDTFATDGATALGYMADLIADGSMSTAVANYSQEDARTQFVTSKAAMMINGPWELASLAESGIDYGVAPLPAGKEAATGMGGENVVTFAEAKAPEAATKFLEFITGTAGAKAFCDTSGQLSARVDLAGKSALSDDPDMQVFEAQLEVAHARVHGGKYPEISAAVQEAVQLTVTGAKSPQEAAKLAATKIDSLIG